MRGAARLGLILATATGGWLVAAAAVATPVGACGTVAPGNTNCAPDQLTVSSSATVAASKSGTITTSPKGITATYTEKVYYDPSNMYCANCLDWVIEITNTSSSTDKVERATISNFQNFEVDLGYIKPPNTAPGMTNPSGGQVPNNTERDSSGSNLAWDFNTSGAEISAGQSSVLIIAMTNARTVVPGTISVQDGEAGSDSAYGPALPEAGWVPGIALLGGALAGFAVLRRRRSQTR